MKLIYQLFFTVISIFFFAFCVNGNPSINLANSGVDTIQYQDEPFSFPVDSGKFILEGTLSVPENYDNTAGKAIILVSPPSSPNSRNYGGLYSHLARQLAGQGISVLRYDNRSYVDKYLAQRNGLTKYGQAKDALAALAALKKDHRFTHVSIGLLGHSEGGSSVVIAAADNPDISFVVLMSTLGVPGSEFTYNQYVRNINNLDKVSKALGPEEKKIMFGRLKQHINIMTNYQDVDTMFMRLKASYKAYHKKYSKEFPKMFGTASLEKHYKHDSLTWLNPHRIAFVQFEPARYYPKIECPVLVVFGKKDEKLQWDKNMAGIERLFKQSSKTNYRLVALDSLNHSYVKYQPLDEIAFLWENHRNPNATSDRVYSQQAFQLIADWIQRGYQ